MSPTTFRRPLADRFLQFAQDIRTFCRQLPPTIEHDEDRRQLVRSSGAIGANFLEADNALGQKDFRMRLRIARKEAKESEFWLKLLQCPDPLATERQRLISEAHQILLILSSVIRNMEAGKRSIHVHSPNLAS